MIFRQLFDPKSFTFSYIIGSEKTQEAVIIDPVHGYFERDKKLIKELDLELKWILETHCHIDHISGAFNLKEAFPEVKVGLPEYYGSEFADINISEEDVFNIGEIRLKTIFTPGHTNGSFSYYTEGKVFTGDSLLIRSCGRTDLQGGNSEILYNSVTQNLFSLPENTFIYPGHDYSGYLYSTIKEEKLYNPLFSGVTKSEFFSLLKNNKPVGNIQAVIIKESSQIERPIMDFAIKSEKWMSGRI